MGIGLATALAFARHGARTVLTYKWGTVDEDTVRERFRGEGLPEPLIVRADAGSDEDTAALIAEMRQRFDAVDTFVSNVSAALVVGELEAYSKKSLFRSIEYSAWPMVDYTMRIKAAFGAYPRYVIGISSTGVDSYSRGYDFMAAAKAVMETLMRYMNYRLSGEGVRINVVRSRNVRTVALTDTFGADFEAFAGRFTRDQHYLSPDEVGEFILALASGLCDGVSGQVLTVDRGTTFFDNMMRLYEERDALGL